ncbi:MAG: bifunctional UDP-N-acetylglucosamine diphosphorylase/glucosamine-1-phosphate N-acetyltransferase GlmU [Candidatus Dormibacteria bacterium]
MADSTLVRAVILAAGRGTRMVSSRSKPLHEVGGLPMIQHVLRSVSEVVPEAPIVVVAPGDRALLAQLGDRAVAVIQATGSGTGAAVLAARAALGDAGAALVLPADMPLLSPESLRSLVATLQSTAAGAAALVAEVEDPASYGRIERDRGGGLLRIVEAADEPARRGAAEVNCGAYLFRLPQLWDALAELDSDNAQSELYLSWAPARIAGGCALVSLPDPTEALQINDRIQLARAEAAFRRRSLRRLMLAGVTVVDPESTWVDCDVRVGSDSVLHPGTVLRGSTVVGRHCELGPFAELDSCEVADGCRVGRSSLHGCRLEEGVDVGPFNRVRPGTVLGPRSHLGTFTEVVRSRVGAGSQVPHLSYVGDAELGDDVNVGAGTITANWDGIAKRRTVIEDGVRLGSDTILVAPIRVGKMAYTAAGSVLTGDVPPGSLAVARVPQRNLEGWVARRRRHGRPVAEVAEEEDG